jgi:hypothetical protein
MAILFYVRMTASIEVAYDLENSIPGSHAEKLSAGWDVVSANTQGILALRHNT